MLSQDHAPSRRRVAVIGAGPAGLMAAEVIAARGHAVTVFDRMPSAGRKLLMAGRGGLNLTHSEPLDRFLSRYHSASPHIASAVSDFTPAQLTAWCESLGQETFIGSSGRVFPKAFKASPLLRAWLNRLAEAGVVLQSNTCWTGWDASGTLTFEGPNGQPRTFAADATVLALGGASWPRLGSDGRWVRILEEAGVIVSPLKASNCSVLINWSPLLISRHAGEPLKRIAVTLDGEMRRGEAVITRYGLEGNVIYALSSAVRAKLDTGADVQLLIDLRPDESLDQTKARLSGYRGRQSMGNFLRKALKLSPAAITLLYEGLRGPLPADQMERARLIKAVPITITGLSGLDRAISSSGGVKMSEIDPNFMLQSRPGVFVAGEMLDWDAPTGGYLLQASCATGAVAGRGVCAWLDGPTVAGVRTYEQSKD